MTPEKCNLQLGETVIGSVVHQHGSWAYKGELLGVVLDSQFVEQFVVHVTHLKQLHDADWMAMSGNTMFAGRGDLRLMRSVEAAP